MPVLALLLFALPALTSAEPPPIRIAIIIDDLGNSLTRGREAVALPAALTYAILPMRPHSRTIAEHAHRHGKEVMLHLPMQALDNRRMGPGGLHDAMDRSALQQALQTGLGAVPHVAGVNNHMGSLLTRRPLAMDWLMEELSCIGDLYFVDSRTDVRSIARQRARRAGVANAQRDVFLDNEADVGYIRNQLAKLITLARRHGSAVGIGHPYPETLAVLAEVLPRLAKVGIEVVPVSQLVERQRGPKIWHACSSHLQTAAKNSRPLPSSICCDAPASRSSPLD